MSSSHCLLIQITMGVQKITSESNHVKQISCPWILCFRNSDEMEQGWLLSPPQHLVLAGRSKSWISQVCGSWWWLLFANLSSSLEWTLGLSPHRLVWAARERYTKTILPFTPWFWKSRSFLSRFHLSEPLGVTSVQEGTRLHFWTKSDRILKTVRLESLCEHPQIQILQHFFFLNCCNVFLTGLATSASVLPFRCDTHSNLEKHVTVDHLDPVTWDKVQP